MNFDSPIVRGAVAGGATYLVLDYLIIKNRTLAIGAGALVAFVAWFTAKAKQTGGI